VTTHYDDEAQVEELRRWWKENWFALAIGLGLGFGVIFGMQAFKARRDVQRMEASKLFDDLSTAVSAHKDSDADTMGKRLIAEFKNTPYAAQAQLQLAQSAIEAGRLDDARQRLQWVVDLEQQHSLGDVLNRVLPTGIAGTGHDPALGDVARLRLARVLWQMGKAEDALAQLKLPHDAAFDSLYAELRGDIALSRSDRTTARAAYQDAVKTLDANAKNKDELQQKLDGVADAGGTSS
jgi:predicted negative regulator of RcsB-dependent stress response